MSVYAADDELVFMPDPAGLRRVGSSKLREVNLRSVGDFQGVVSGTPGALFAWIIDGKTVVRAAGQYSVCITSDDGSYLYVNGRLVVSNGGLHGDVRKCATVALGEGAQAVQVRGFNNYGGASQVLTYSGPDTNQKDVYMPCSVTTGAVAQNLGGKLAGFSLAVFTAPYGLGSMPDLGSQDLRLVGPATVASINVQSLDDLAKLFPGVQATNFGWAAYGKATILTEGTYTLCITSDDG